MTPIVQAQSTGDTINLPTNTATPQPPPTSQLTATPLPTAPPIEQKIWVGRLISNTLGVTEGNGSIFRVSVNGILDTPIEVRTDDQLISGNSGSKPEYGSFAAEFAPVTPGFWTVSVPAIGASLQVEADGYNLAVIEFVEVPSAEATRTVAATVSPTPLGGVTWAGQITDESPSTGVPFARLLITVSGRDGQPVQISTFTQVLNTAFTGQKPDEIGANTVEFAGLTPGTYFIDPLGLATTLQVELKPNTEVRVVFNPVVPTSTPVPSVEVSPTPALLPTFTPAPATPIATITVTPTPPLPPAPTATPTSPVTRWIGAVESRAPADVGQLTVKVAGIEGVAVRLTRTDDDTFQERRCATGEAGYEQDTCGFANLAAGWYLVTPEGLGVSLPLYLDNNQAAQVGFAVEVLPPDITDWQARINQNTNNFLAHPKTDSVIRVRVDGRLGQVVALQSVRLGKTVYCETAYSPIVGGLICEFGRLGPGVYQVEALHTNARQSVFVDGVGQAEIEFSPSATDATQAASSEPAVVGRGAQPRTPTPTLAPTRTPVPAAPTNQPPPPQSPLTATATLTLTVTVTVAPTPTPAMAWQGRVVDTSVTGAGAIAVRAAGLKDHPVVVRSGGWQSPAQLTGTKPELGDYATEFGGLAQGEYIVELVDLAEFRVTLDGGQFVLVEFRYDFVTSP